MEYIDGVTLEDLVRRDGPQPEARVIHILVQLASALAEAHRVPGTPVYLAPETISAPRTVDGSVDIYGLGGVGYFLLTGGPMFAGATVLEIAYHQMYPSPISPSERRGAPISPELEALVLACLAKDPGERPHALTEKLTHLSHCHRWAAAESGAWWGAWRHHQQAPTPVAATVEGTVIADDSLVAV